MKDDKRPNGPPMDDPLGESAGKPISNPDPVVKRTNFVFGKDMTPAGIADVINRATKRGKYADGAK